MVADFYNMWFGDITLADLWCQVGVIGACFVAGWSLSCLIRKASSLSGEQHSVVRISFKSFIRVLTPLLILIFLGLTKWLLIHFHLPVNLWGIMFPLMISQVAMRFVFYILRGIFVRDTSATIFLPLFEKVFAALVWICVILYITGLLPGLLLRLDSIVIPLGRNNQISLLTILQGSVSVLVALMIALWLGALLEQRLMRLSTMHSSLRTVVARLVRAMLILCAVLFSLSLVGIDLTVLSVFGGALGVGLGLGMQKIASSYVSGFVILFERSMVIGDMVNVDTYLGKVTQINTRYTVLEGLDGIESVLPNDIFMTSVVQNYSLTHKIIRLATRVTILYQEDVDGVLSSLETATLSVERVLKKTLPQALLIKIGPDGLELEVGFWISDPENGRLNVLSDVNRAIWRTLQAQGIRVAYPKRDIRVADQRSFEQKFRENESCMPKVV